VDTSTLFVDSLTIWLVMGILGVMSLLSWSIAVFRGAALWRTRRAVTHDALRFEAAPDRRAILGRLPGAHPVVERVVAAGERELARLADLPAGERPQEAPTRPVERALQEAASAELHSLSLGLPALATCAVVAPLLGLFGTVWGIMTAFLTAHQLGSTTLVALAPGVAEALVTTIAGLVVAIPATLFHHVLQRQHARTELHLSAAMAAYVNRLPPALR